MTGKKGELKNLHRISALRLQMVNPNTGRLYIFGYGSLIWKPNIKFTRSWSGYIKGYLRRFYQGTTTHRGTQEWPGRVATLIPSTIEESRVWGVAYEVNGIKDINDALEHLAEREMITGGYRFDEVNFFAQKLLFAVDDSVHDELSPVLDSNNATIQFPTQVYIAGPNNEQYVGEAALEIQAYQIAKAVGHCGPNVEYLQKIVDFVLREVPDVDQRWETYLFDLQTLVHDYISKRKSLPKEYSQDAARFFPSRASNESNSADNIDALQCISFMLF